MIQVGGVSFGGKEVPIIAGPCSIESQAQFTEIAKELKSMGVPLLRGGLYKLRTSVESFQGLGKEGYELVKQVSKEFDLPFVTEVTDPRQIEELLPFTSAFQVGTRNMYNYDLLKELGKTQTPVLLKRAFSATYGEFLNAAEYVTSQGNPSVLLCERGIRTFVQETRNTFDINIIPFLKKNSHLPVLADPSHGTGETYMVLPVALAALAAGADGLLIEVHNKPEEALSDGQQAVKPQDMKKFLDQANTVLNSIGRSLYGRS
jgi:3-deoxy-7-phosphoheptulonate synthase